MPAEPKLSAALLDFARPLLELAPDGAGPDQWTPPLTIAVLVWNAVALDAVGRRNDYLEQARATILAATTGMQRDFSLAMLADMEQRKRSETPLDTRLIGEFRFVTGTDGEVRLSVDCRALRDGPSASPTASN